MPTGRRPPLHWMLLFLWYLTGIAVLYLTMHGDVSFVWVEQFRDFPILGVNYSLHVSSGTQLLTHPFHIQNNDLFLWSIDISAFILFVFIKAMWHLSNLKKPVESEFTNLFLYFSLFTVLTSRHTSLLINLLTVLSEGRNYNGYFSWTFEP